MSGPGFIVSPRRKQDIYDIAASVRNAFMRFFGNAPYVPIDKLYELLPELLPGFQLEVCEHAEMGPDHGRCYPAQRLIKLRVDVYDGMCEGQGRDRFTGAHELGHLFLHANVSFARVIEPSSRIEIFRDSEWQANTFASGLLINQAALARCASLSEVVRTFGVSEDAARVRFKK
ncbi:ImmA/IrrE family metallo-endopeptidase [Variovorax sp. CCNWLW186]|uniref:ImmA/IrrE family metallo-endopeptidase n=1 Tax=Variovorax sp. CCNWLW186 TaxID=3127473 RepID=UPI003077C18D